MKDLTVLLLGIVWFIIAAIVGSFGKNRTIGFIGAYYSSLFFSPLLAMLFVLACDKKVDKVSNGKVIALVLPSLIIPVILLYYYANY
jgi:preprotein translocase subunit SecF